MLGESRTQDPQRIARLAQRLMPPFGALLVSMGASGGVWAQAGTACWARVPEVKVISTVGSGDASLAGAVFALARGMDAQGALALAMACGAANALLGEVGSVRAQDVQELMNHIEMEEIDLCCM